MRYTLDLLNNNSQTSMLVYSRAKLERQHTTKAATLLIQLYKPRKYILKNKRERK